MVVPSDHQSSEVAPPGKSAFDLPSSLVAAQWTPILGRRLLAILPVRTNQLDAPSGQSCSQRIGVSGFVVDQPIWIFPRTTSSRSRDCYLLQRRLDQRDFRWRRRFQVVSQRNTRAVDHHHPLRTLSAVGFSDAAPPFFAGATLPSAKVSAQSSWPCSASCLSRARQAFSQISCASQSRSRRQQVLGEGYRSGRSFQEHHSVTPIRSLRRQDDWGLVGGLLWGKLSARAATGRYAPIGHRLVRIGVET